MCGIVGRYNFRSDASVNRPQIKKMCRLLVHRGPDEQGEFTDGPLGFGHRRLSVIDLTSAACQPMTSEMANSVLLIMVKSIISVSLEFI